MDFQWDHTHRISTLYTKNFGWQLVDQTPKILGGGGCESIVETWHRKKLLPHIDFMQEDRLRVGNVEYSKYYED